MELTITQGGPADAGAVGELHVRSRRAAYAALLSPRTLAGMNVAAAGADWAQRVTREAGTHRLLLAHDGGGLVGFAYLGAGAVEDALPAGTGILNALHCRPEAVGTGVGRRLHESCLRSLGELGHGAAVLWVLESNERARRFYAIAGWQPDGAEREAAVGTQPTRQIRYARKIP